MYDLAYHTFVFSALGSCSLQLPPQETKRAHTQKLKKEEGKKKNTAKFLRCKKIYQSHGEYNLRSLIMTVNCNDRRKQANHLWMVYLIFRDNVVSLIDLVTYAEV